MPDSEPVQAEKDDAEVQNLPGSANRPRYDVVEIGRGVIGGHLDNVRRRFAGFGSELLGRGGFRCVSETVRVTGRVGMCLAGEHRHDELHLI